jgi:hypothetical protein
MLDDVDRFRRYCAAEKARLLPLCPGLYSGETDEPVPPSLKTLPEIAARLGGSVNYVRRVLYLCDVKPDRIVTTRPGPPLPLFQFSRVVREVRACRKQQPDLVRKFEARYKGQGKVRATGTESHR